MAMAGENPQEQSTENPGDETGQEQATEGGGGDPQSQVAQLVGNVSQGLTLLAQIMNKIPGTPDEDKQTMQSLIDGFHGLVQKLASEGGGDASQGQGQAQAGPQPAPKAKAVPMRGARQGVPVGPGGM